MFGRNKNASESINENNYTTTVSGVEKITKKGVGRKIAVISGVSAAVVVGGGIAAYNLSPFVKNQVKLRVMKPEKYYAWVYEENGHDLAKKLSEGYDKRLSRYEDGQRSNIRLEYEPTEEALQAFREEMELTDEYGLDEAELNLLKAINSTEKLGAVLDAYIKNGDMKLSLSADRNDERIVSFDILLSDVGHDFFARAPQLTEQWLGVSFGDILDSDLESNPEAKKMVDSFRNICENPRSYLSPDELEAEILRYIDVWNDAVERVRLKNSEEVEINDVTVKYTVASVRINRNMAREIARDFLDSASDDEIIKGLLVDKIGIIDEEEYNDFFEEALDELNEDYEDDYDDDDDDESVTFRTYIDGKGVIRGFEVRQNSDNKFIAAIGKKGRIVSGEISLTSDGTKEFEIDLYAEETGKDEYSGSIEFISWSNRYDYDLDEFFEEKEKYSIEFEDFSIVNEERNYFNADITIITPDFDPIKIEFDAGSNYQSVIYEIVVDDIDYGRISLTWSTEDDAEIGIPNKSESFMFDPEADESFDFEAYVDRVQVKKFLKDILLKLDMDEKFVEDIAEEAVEEFYDGVTDICDEIW